MSLYPFSDGSAEYPDKPLLSEQARIAEQTPVSCSQCLDTGFVHTGFEIKACPLCSPEPTFCIDCGQPTTPGKGSARCPGCWSDRCGQ